MDTEQLERAISPRTKAIIPVYLNGRLCDMEKLMDIASRHNLILIEDAAQTLGATFDGEKAGSFGLAGCYSFYPAKILGAAGDGGIVTTNNQEFAEKIRLLRDHGQQRTTGDILCFGFNSRLDNLQAAILNLKLKYMPRWIERRREIAGMYYNSLSDISQLDLPASPKAEGPYFDVFQNYVIRCKERDDLVAYLRENDVEVLISWPVPNHFHKGLGLTHFKLPETESISNEVVSLPMNTEIPDDQVQYVIKTVRNFFKK